jgi:hypothetical protein
VKLQVPEDSLAEARVLASQLWSPPRQERDDLDEAWDDLAPEPGARLRFVMELAMTVLGIGIAILLVGLAVAAFLR